MCCLFACHLRLCARVQYVYGVLPFWLSKCACVRASCVHAHVRLCESVCGQVQTLRWDDFFDHDVLMDGLHKLIIKIDIEGTLISLNEERLLIVGSVSACGVLSREGFGSHAPDCSLSRCKGGEADVLPSMMPFIRERMPIMQLGVTPPLAQQQDPCRSDLRTIVTHVPFRPCLVRRRRCARCAVGRLCAVSIVPMIGLQ